MNNIINTLPDTIEHLFEIENELMRFVSMGDYENALKYYKNFKSFRFIQYTELTIERGKKELIIMNTILRKALEQANAHPYYINAIYEDFSSKIDTLSDITNIYILEIDMLQEYCYCVQFYSIKSHNTMIQKIIHYINLNLGNDLSLNTLAQTFHLSHSYLCKLFKKETGYTLTEYISNQRIKYASAALCHTSNPISEIAFSVGYLDVNYFSRQFKQIVGVTPTQYRKTYIKIYSS